MIRLPGWRYLYKKAVRFSPFGIIAVLMCGLVLGIPAGYADGWLPDTSATQGDDRSAAPNVIVNDPSSLTKERAVAGSTKLGGIINTRHNLTMSYNSLNGIMDQFRNNYYEICVYCHTPHGANSTADAPLWNRTVTQRTYTLFNDPVSSFRTTMDLNYTQPGPNSLTCLSCHDGATAIDSVINMPTQITGAFRAGYSADQQTSVNPDFLDAWGDNKIGAPSPANSNTANAGHVGFNSSGSYCISCHNAGQGGIGPDFMVFSIGDQYVARNDDTAQLNRETSFLRDDHPIGVQYPEYDIKNDYKDPDVKLAKIAFFDLNGNGHADPNEVRLYNTGDGYEVECGSCHDPHGVKVDGVGNNDLIPSFLRVGRYEPSVSTADGSTRRQVSANDGSSLCLTCHIK